MKMVKSLLLDILPGGGDGFSTETGGISPGPDTGGGNVFDIEGAGFG